MNIQFDNPLQSLIKQTLTTLSLHSLVQVINKPTHRCGQAERKWRNTKLTIFKDLYRQAKYKVSKLVHSAKCKFYTERIALASSSKELHQIVNIQIDSQIDIHLKYFQPFTLVLTFPVFSSNTLPTK